MCGEVSEQHPLHCVARSILQARRRYHRGRGMDCFATSVNLNLPERQAQGSDDLSVMEGADCYPCDFTVSLVIIGVFQLPADFASICAYNSLFFFNLKTVKDYILITELWRTAGKPEPLKHRGAERKQNYPKQSLKNKAEQKPF